MPKTEPPAPTSIVRLINAEREHLIAKNVTSFCVSLASDLPHYATQSQWLLNVMKLLTRRIINNSFIISILKKFEIWFEIKFSFINNTLNLSLFCECAIVRFLVRPALSAAVLFSSTQCSSGLQCIAVRFSCCMFSHFGDILLLFLFNFIPHKSGIFN